MSAIELVRPFAHPESVASVTERFIELANTLAEEELLVAHQFGLVAVGEMSCGKNLTEPETLLLVRNRIQASEANQPVLVDFESWSKPDPRQATPGESARLTTNRGEPSIMPRQLKHDIRGGQIRPWSLHIKQPIVRLADLAISGEMTAKRIHALDQFRMWTYLELGSTELNRVEARLAS